jgi:hypothetical protein
MANETDKVVQQLFEVVQKKKAEIAKAEKPNWTTNCAFRYNKDSSASTNIQVCADVEELIGMLGFLIEKQNAFNAAQEILGTTHKFKWGGFSVEDWTNDISTRINKIQIGNKKKELEALEARLDKLVSPELKAQMELAEISKLLGK